MEYNFEIGDTFIIVDNKYWNYNCVQQNEFIITDFTKSRLSVYYEDRRTNIKCKCNNCEKPIGEKCIGIHSIKLVRTKKQRERELKLKKLGI